MDPGVRRRSRSTLPQRRPGPDAKRSAVSATAHMIAIRTWSDLATSSMARTRRRLNP